MNAIYRKSQNTGSCSSLKIGSFVQVKLINIITHKTFLFPVLLLFKKLFGPRMQDMTGLKVDGYLKKSDFYNFELNLVTNQ